MPVHTALVLYPSPYSLADIEKLADQAGEPGKSFHCHLAPISNTSTHYSEACE
jgi:hypothetical protein